MEMFAKRLSKVRENAGVSVEEVASHLKINKKTVENWEKNVSSPKNAFGVLIKLSKYFKVSAEWLLGIE